VVALGDEPLTDVAQPVDGHAGVVDQSAHDGLLSLPRTTTVVRRRTHRRRSIDPCGRQPGSVERIQRDVDVDTRVFTGVGL
jgi:hypothetical protein